MNMIKISSGNVGWGVLYEKCHKYTLDISQLIPLSSWDLSVSGNISKCSDFWVLRSTKFAPTLPLDNLEGGCQNGSDGMGISWEKSIGEQYRKYLLSVEQMWVWTRSMHWKPSSIKPDQNASPFHLYLLLGILSWCKAHLGVERLIFMATSRPWYQLAWFPRGLTKDSVNTL